MAASKAKKVIKKKTAKRLHDQISKKLKNSKKLAKEEAWLQKKIEKEGLRERGEVPKGNIALKKKGDATFKNKTREIKRHIGKEKKKQVQKRDHVSKGNSPGVIYLGNIPHGFYDNQMEKYFSQFGEVVNVRHVRSDKTGRSCGYAYISFRHKAVAQIVADTMNNYLTFGKIMKCKYIGNSEKLNSVKFLGDRFKPSNCPGVLRRSAYINELNARRKDAINVRNIQDRTYSITKKLDLLKSLGVNVDLKVDVGSLETRLQDKKDRNKKRQETLETEEKPVEDEETVRIGATSSESFGAVKQKEKVIFEADQSDDEIVVKTPPFAKKKFVKITPSSPAARIVDNKSQISSIKKVLDQDLSAVSSTSNDASETPDVKKTFKVLQVKKSLKLTPGKEGTSVKDASSCIKNETLTKHNLMETTSGKKDKSKETPKTPKEFKKTPRVLTADVNETPVAKKRKSLKVTEETPKAEVLESLNENSFGSVKKNKSKKTPKKPQKH